MPFFGLVIVRTNKNESIGVIRHERHTLRVVVFFLYFSCVRTYILSC